MQCELPNRYQSVIARARSLHQLHLINTVIRANTAQSCELGANLKALDFGRGLGSSKPSGRRLVFGLIIVADVDEAVEKVDEAEETADAFELAETLWLLEINDDA